MNIHCDDAKIPVSLLQRNFTKACTRRSSSLLLHRYSRLLLLLLSWLYGLLATTTTTRRTMTSNNHSRLRILVFVDAISTSISRGIVPTKFNDQLMPRVTERLDDYLQKPVTMARNLVNFHSIAGFRSGADRDAVFQYILSNSVTNRESGYPVEVFVTLEDGVHVAFQSLNSNEYFTYREPGNSGYPITDDVRSGNDPNSKYFNSCFNTTDGYPYECIMFEEEPYVQCINDCELIPCVDLEESNNTTVREQESNETIIWCRNYRINTVQADEELGYIPTFDLCINQEGKPEQRPGMVLVNYSSQELGDCTYSDYVTIVNNTLSGDYAACGGNGMVCNNAFYGAQYEKDSDVRTREYYRRMKNQQQYAEWTDPFFYYKSRTMSIGYENPLYKEEITNNYNAGNITKNHSTTQTTTNKRIVFDGVVAVDYQLGEVTNFLSESFADTEIQVVVFESWEPYYIIASSKQEYQVKYVLVSDPMKPCPDEYIFKYHIDDECNSERRTMDDLKDVDIVLYRSYLAHVQANFPTTSIVNIKESDDIGSKAYATQGNTYQLPQSFKNKTWQVIATLPMSRATNDAAMPGDSTFFVVCFVGILGFIGCLVLFVKFYSRRMEPAMVYADWRFTCAFIMGCTLLNLSTLTLLGSNTNAMCMVRMWSFNGLFACALSPLFVKVWRMATLLNASKGMKRVAITNSQALVYTLPLIVIQCIILLIFTFVDPPRQTEQLGVGDGIGVQQITCEQRTNAFFITQVFYDGFLVLVGCVLAYMTRNMNPKFGEAKQLGFSMYNIAFTGIVCILTIRLVDMDQLSQMILQAVGVFWASFFCSLSFVLPRLLEAADERRKSRRESSDDSSSALAVKFKFISGVDNLSVVQNNHTKEENENDTSSPLINEVPLISSTKSNQNNVTFADVECPNNNNEETTDLVLPNNKKNTNSNWETALSEDSTTCFLHNHVHDDANKKDVAKELDQYANTTIEKQHHPLQASQQQDKEGQDERHGEGQPPCLPMTSTSSSSFIKNNSTVRNNMDDSTIRNEPSSEGEVNQSYDKNHNINHTNINAYRTAVVNFMDGFTVPSDLAIGTTCTDNDSHNV